MERISLGVSSCLLGEQVRYDGGHKRESFVADVLPRYFDLIPVCPEVAIGLGVPRQPIRLVGDAQRPRALGVRDPQLDVTEQLADYGEQTAKRLSAISGYVLKSKSPSCGMQRVKVYREQGGFPGKGRGIFASALMARLPPLPVEEEGRLQDARLRENFIGRVHAYRRWQELNSQGVSAQGLIDFHAAHKLILMAHNKEGLRALGRLIAQAGVLPVDELAARYIALFMQTLARPATRKRHADVLYHLLGYLKRKLDAADKAEMVELIEMYRQEAVPLVVPVALLRHHFRRNPEPYVEKQLYLNWPTAGMGI